MASHKLQEERTFVLVKPDGVKRGLIGEITHRFEQRGLKIIAMQMMYATRNQIAGHFPKDQAWVHRLGEKSLNTYTKYGLDPKAQLGTDDADKIGAMVKEWLFEFLTSGPMVKMVVEGVHAIDMVRKICGNTLPNLADMGTLRGDYSVDSPALANAGKRAVHNIIHASENAAEAENEIKHWFKKEDIHGYKRAEEDIMF